MNPTKQRANPDIEPNFELVPGLIRQDSEAEWAKQIKQQREMNQKEFFRQPDNDDNFLTSQIRMTVHDPFRRMPKKLDTETESFAKTLRYAKFGHGSLHLPALSRFNSIINEELGLEKRAAMYEERSIEVSMNRSGELNSESLLQCPVMEKKRYTQDDHFIPNLSRFKSSESFSVNIAHNCSAYQFNDETLNNMLPGYRNLEYPNFGSLLDLLKKHFKGKMIDEKDLSLSPHELDVLKSIITRKYKSKINVDVKSFFLKDKLLEIDQLGSLKRPEENLKFVFKRCMKYLKERLRAFDGQKLKKKEFDDYFYEYYFGDVCKKYNLPLDAIQNPCNSKGVKTKLKTVNTEYISNIAKSEKFMKDLIDYMHNNLTKDYESTIDSKINALVKRWDDTYEKAQEKTLSLQDIIDYVLKNKKCKLPWTGKEISGAVNCVENTFDECIKGLTDD